MITWPAFFLPEKNLYANIYSVLNVFLYHAHSLSLTHLHTRKAKSQTRIPGISHSYTSSMQGILVKRNLIMRNAIHDRPRAITQVFIQTEKKM
jgi:hypothetical protein